MPTYEYRCKGCGQHLEVVQAFTDDALTTCEACGGELRKVFGSVGISFKGSGFYKTDSRATSGKGAGTGAKSDSGSGDTGGAKESSGSGDAAKSDTAAKADTAKSGSDTSTSAATPA